MPPPTIRIKDALEQCPIKTEYFKTTSENVKHQKDGKFKDTLLKSLDCHLNELRIKKYSFVTDGIETKNDITELGMSDNQLKKRNRVRKPSFFVETVIFSCDVKK